ncbi:hypothetical protein GGF41_004274, partial [Coemansia sp. RSA 2531]
RLDNDFYRHPSAVAFDVGLILENAETFNDPGTLVPIAAKQLVTQYRQQASQVLGNGDLLEGGEHDHYGQEMSSPVARRSTRRSSAVPNGNHTVSPASAPASARQSRKRKPQAAATRSGRCVSRRVDPDSDESDFADHYSEDNEHRGAGGVRRRLRQKSHAYDEEDEESEEDRYSENDDDDEDMYS